MRTSARPQTMPQTIPIAIRFSRAGPPPDKLINSSLSSQLLARGEPGRRGIVRQAQRVRKAGVGKMGFAPGRCRQNFGFLSQ